MTVEEIEQSVEVFKKTLNQKNVVLCKNDRDIWINVFLVKEGEKEAYGVKQLIIGSFTPNTKDMK